MRQHYIPQFYLTNFASKEGKRNKIWVLDKVEQRQWTTSPTKAAHRRNYYRYSEETTDDPDEIEHAMGKIESLAAPVLRKILASKNLPESDEERGILLNFVALMAVRVPGARGVTRVLAEKLNKMCLRELVSSQETFKAHLELMRKDGVKVDDSMDYETMQEFVVRDEFSIETPIEFELDSMLISFDIILELLAQRNWFLLIANESASDFVCSDRPVTLDWIGQPPGFPCNLPGFGMLNSIVRLPLSRRMTLAGLFDRAELTCEASAELVGQTNACTCGTAERFIYSATQDFVWMHRDRSLKNVDHLMGELKASVRQ